LLAAYSGIFSLALAVAARVHRLRFAAVVDSLATLAHVMPMRHYGAAVVLVGQVDPRGGYLADRRAALA
jgi:N-(2-amino-2-carboxyethyl)-L-glutamate synthase